MTRPSAAMVIYECMRIIDGRHEMYSCSEAREWLLDNDYCFPVGTDVSLTVKGERFAETLIKKSGIVPILEEFE